MEKGKPPVEVQESVEVLQMLAKEKMAMSPNEEIWEFLVEQFLSRTDIYKAVASDEGYKLVHPLKPRTDYMTIYPIDLRASLTTTSANKVTTLIALTYAPTWGAIIQKVRGSSNELRVFPREPIDEAMWKLFKSRI